MLPAETHGRRCRRFGPATVRPYGGSGRLATCARPRSATFCAPGRPARSPPPRLGRSGTPKVPILRTGGLTVRNSGTLGCLGAGRAVVWPRQKSRSPAAPRVGVQPNLPVCVRFALKYAEQEVSRLGSPGNLRKCVRPARMHANPEVSLLVRQPAPGGGVSGSTMKCEQRRRACSSFAVPAKAHPVRRALRTCRRRATIR